MAVAESFASRVDEPPLSAADNVESDASSVRRMKTGFEAIMHDKTSESGAGPLALIATRVLRYMCRRSSKL